MASNPLKIAVIGGSAGSLVALQALFENLPMQCGMACVVIQHLSPGHVSVLHELIARWTVRPVHGIEGDVRLEAGHVYVAKPGQFLYQKGTELHLAEGVAEEDVHRPIDVYCRSLAKATGRRAALVVLSGALDDGSRGAEAIRQAGGVVLVQDPAGAQYASMPEKAMASGQVDRVQEPAGLAASLCSWGRTGRFDTDVVAEDVAVKEAQVFDAILQLVRVHSRNDMAGYKPSTLMRRIERRMGLSHAGSLEDYHQLLQRNAMELDVLCKDLLIGVTAFFRDPEAFLVLESQVVPRLCEGKAAEEPVRAWVAGCSTGEEVYSIAMLLMEWFAAHGQPPRVQIFATDIDDAALEVARAGRYDQVAMEGVSPERRQRFFTEYKDGFRIAKDVRECIVFASHNLISDPPFSRLDLVVCRNLLIYLNLDTQKKLLKLFRFVLNPGAFLFLGSSESLGSAGRYFQVVSKPWRLYRHTADAPRRPPRMPIAAGAAMRRLPGAGEMLPELGGLAVQDRIFQELLQRHGPTQLVINGRHEVLYLTGSPGPYLTVPMGQPSRDLFKMAAPELGAALRSAINRAQRTQARASVSAISLGNDEAGQPVSNGVRIEVAPLGDGPQTDLMWVSFGQEAAQQGVLSQAGAGGDDWVLRQLEQELNATREDLQRTIDQARTTSEEMKAANEEAMAMNEELQSANEELESSKEELQSLNEELVTANTNLDAKVLEVESLNTDLNNLLYSTETAMLMLDESLCIRRFTPACAQLLRIIPSDIGRAVEDLAWQFEDASLVEDCRKVMAGMRVADKEIAGLEASWYLRRIRPYRDGEGKMAGVVLTFPDISDLKQADALLRERSRVLEWQAGLLSRAAPVVGRDMDDRIIFWNRGAEALYGWTDQDALGRVTHDLLQTRFPLSLAEIKQKLFARGVWKGELIHTCADGREVAVESQWTLFRDEAGQVQAIVEVNNDVTEGKAAKEELARYQQYLEELVTQRTEALQAAEARARLILDSSGDGLYGIDLQGRVTFINTAACQLLGYTPEEMQGHSIHALIHHTRADGSPYPEAECPMLQTLRDGKAVQVDNDVYWHADGHAIPVLYSIHPMRRGEDVVGAVVSFFDNTERKAMETEREAARAEAERLARVKSEFLANMSHEIRTPLNAVLGFAQVGRRENAGRKVQQTFERILDSGQLLLGIINDILDYSKIEAGKLGLENGVVELGRLIDRAYDLMVERAHAKGLDLRVEEAPDLPATCRGDALRLSQVLLNLLSNAIKFTAQGQVSLYAGRQGDTLVLRVSDTGIGMTDEEMTGLFQPFRQADSSTTRRFGGTGLGLTISKRIIGLMGGDIQVASEVGRGSRFEVRLPLLEPAGQALQHSPGAFKPAAASLPGARLAGYAILAAEDNEVNRLVMEDMMRGEGARLVQVENGLLALQRVMAEGERAFDIVLMDVQMPVMDGYEATQRIREVAPNLPVVGLTAHALAEDREKCRAAGMVDRVTKPVDLEQLVAVIRQHARPGGDLVHETAAAAGSASSVMTSAATIYIDRDQLAARHPGRPEFVARLLAMVLKSNAGKAEQLRDLARAGDLENLAFVAHGIKGEAGNIQAHGLRDLAARTELAARQRQAEAAALAEELATALEHILADIAASLPNNTEKN